MSNKTTLDSMCPGAAGAGMGTKLDALITMANELKADFNLLRAEVVDLHTKLGAAITDAAAVHTQVAAIVADVTAIKAAHDLHVAAAAHPDAGNAAPALTAAAPAAATATAPAAMTSTAIAAAAVTALN